MPLIGEIGHVSETRGEMRVEWQIIDFPSLSEEVDGHYVSHVFSFADSCWRLKICPNGETDYMSSGWIGLYLTKVCSGPMKAVKFALGIKRRDGGYERLSESDTSNIPDKKSGKGLPKFMLRSELLNMKSELVPSNALTVICILRTNVPHSSEVSLFRRLWKVSRNLRTMLDERKGADFTFKLEGHELCAHKAILESRCDEYFKGMFRHDLRENVNGEVEIEGIEKDVLQCVLSYVYSGEVEDMADQNVCKIYVAADRFLLKELKKICTEYMKENLCLNLICDVITIAENFEEEELRVRAVEFFTQNAAKVSETAEWKTFTEENSALAIRLLVNAFIKR